MDEFVADADLARRVTEGRAPDAEEDKVVVRHTTRAKHVGELLGAAGDGRRVELTGMELYRFSGEQIAELWGEYNMSDLFR